MAPLKGTLFKELANHLFVYLRPEDLHEVVDERVPACLVYVQSRGVKDVPYGFAKLLLITP